MKMIFCFLSIFNFLIYIYSNSNILTRCFLEVKEDDITTGATASINAVN